MRMNVPDPLIEAFIVRTMREGGFPGDVEVVSTRPIRDGISARAVATYRGRSATYRATIVRDKVTVTRTLDPI